MSGRSPVSQLADRHLLPPKTLTLNGTVELMQRRGTGYPHLSQNVLIQDTALTAVARPR